MENAFTPHPSSYRDPSGFIFTKDNVLYRQVNKVFASHYDHFINSGFYNKLIADNLLIPHEEIKENLTGNSNWYCTLKPEPVSFLSWPYEWCFDMLKDAALLTLTLAKEAMAYGMILKDATPYNIQLHKGKLIFIDSLSFEIYNSEEPWIAYRQFCEQFLAPLLLMHHHKTPLQQLMLAWPEGVPLSAAQKLLPGKTRFSLHTYLHIHLNARVSNQPGNDRSKKIKFSRQKLINLLLSLETLVTKLKLPEQKTSWSDYYAEASGRDNYLDDKKRIIGEWLNNCSDIQTAADFGANEGEFARLVAEKNISTVALDFDPYCINRLYNWVKKTGEKKILPLVADLVNPSPAIGLNNQERSSLISRVKVDFGLALALVHHLAIGKNVPFECIAYFFYHTCRKRLLIEFVPKSDEKVQLMLKSKRDIYTDYNEENFVLAFKKYFSIAEKKEIGQSGRVLYLMTRDEN